MKYFLKNIPNLNSGLLVAYSLIESSKLDIYSLDDDEYKLFFLKVFLFFFPGIHLSVFFLFFRCFCFFIFSNTLSPFWKIDKNTSVSDSWHHFLKYDGKTMIICWTTINFGFYSSLSCLLEMIINWTLFLQTSIYL